METAIPTFGPREFIGLIITIAAIVGFLLSAVKLTLSNRRDAVDAGYNSENGGFHVKTQNLSIVTLCVSGILLAVLGTAAFAQGQEKWVYLGPGYGNYKWNFLSLEGAREFSANDIVVATGKVNIRNAASGNFTQTWLSFLSPPEPPTIGMVNPGDCVRVLSFTSVGLNKVWMQIESAECPDG